MRPLVEIEMYEIDDRGLPVERLLPAPRRTIAETLDVWRAALDVVQANASYANSPGGFVAPQVDFPSHTGFREDVQMTLHADPRDASATAIEGGFFEREIAGLLIDESSLRTRKTELSWDAVLRTSPWHHRAATLRLTP